MWSRASSIGLLEVCLVMALLFRATIPVEGGKEATVGGSSRVGARGLLFDAGGSRAALVHGLRGAARGLIPKVWLRGGAGGEGREGNDDADEQEDEGEQDGTGTGREGERNSVGLGRMHDEVGSMIVDSEAKHGDDGRQREGGVGLNKRKSPLEKINFDALEAMEEQEEGKLGGERGRGGRGLASGEWNDYDEHVLLSSAKDTHADSRTDTDRHRHLGKIVPNPKV